MWTAYQRASKYAPLKTNMLTAAGVMFIGDGIAQVYETTSRTSLPSTPVRTRQTSHAGLTESQSLPSCNTNDITDTNGFKLDLVRSTVAMTWNACVFSPTFYYWFRFLDGKFAGTALKSVAAKVLINQLVIPLPLSAGFIAFSATFEPVMRHVFNQNSRHGSQQTPKTHDELTNRESATARSTPERLADHWQDVSDEVYTRLYSDLGTVFTGSCALWIPVNTLNFLLVPAHLRVLPSILVSVGWMTYLSLTAHHKLDGDIGTKS
eukprot:m.15728 g.15728  ORF g.15728 m.15728 type:complete len:264 (-) comp10717_c0_seq1:64-855(-)